MADIKIKATDASDCVDIKLSLTMSKNAKAAVEQRLEAGIADMIAYPVDGTIAIEKKLKSILKPVERKRLKKELIKERARFKEHNILFDLLLDDSINQFHEVSIFQTPIQFLENRLNLIQAVFETTYFQSTWADRTNPYTSGLNNRKLWESKRIRAVKKEFDIMIELEKKRGDEISAFEDTIKAPLLMAMRKDGSGNIFKLLQMNQQLVDQYLAEAYHWKEPVLDPITRKMTENNLDSINREITRAAYKSLIPGQDYNREQLGPVASNLFEELIHTEVRNIIPRDIPSTASDFISWRNTWQGKAFFDAVKLPSERHQIGPGGIEYVMIPLHVLKQRSNALRKFRKEMGDTPIDNENAYLVYRIPPNLTTFFDNIRNNKFITDESLKQHLKPNDLEDGFYRAGADEFFKYDLMPGTNKPKKKFSRFTRGVFFPNAKGGFEYQPPSEWMPGIWKALDMQRNLATDFFKKVLKGKMQEEIKNVDGWMKEIESQLAKAGYPEVDVEEIINKINSIGGLEFNLFPDKDGNYVSANTFIRKASKWSYGHTKFHDLIYKGMLSSAMKDLEQKIIPEWESKLNNHYNVLESPDITAAEELEATEGAAMIESILDDKQEAVDNMRIKLETDPSTEEAKNSIMVADRILASKHRTLFTNKLLRRKDRGLWNEYIDQAYRAIYFFKVKSQLAKTILAIQDKPKLIHYIIDEIKANSGHADIEAGFMWLKYGDELVSKLLPGTYTPEQLRDIGLINRGYKTGITLGTGTSVSNNTQRLNKILNYGFEHWIRAIRGKRDGDSNFTAEELRSQVKETGIIEPFNAYIDMLTMGFAGEDVGWKEMFLPLRDMVVLWKNTSLNGWLASSSGWNKILNRAAERTQAEAVETAALASMSSKISQKELKRIKIGLWEYIHSETRDKKILKRMLRELRLGLTKRYINRLVKWKIDWLPFGRRVFTMKGSEEEMRTEAGIEGFYMAEDLGRVDTSRENWKYTDFPEAVQMARLVTYTNYFGLSKPFMGKLFRGAVGGSAFQWKQYDYNQIIIESQKFRNAVLSNKYGPGWGAVGLPFNITYQILKKTIRAPGIISPKYKELVNLFPFLRLNKEFDSKPMDDLTNLLLTRGLLSVASQFMWYNSVSYGVWRILLRSTKILSRDTHTQRMMWGGSSPLVSRVIHIALFLNMITKMAIRDDDEENILDMIRDWMPVAAFTMAGWLIDFSKYALRGVKQWMPSPFREIILPAEDIYESL